MFLSDHKQRDFEEIFEKFHSRIIFDPRCPVIITLTCLQIIWKEYWDIIIAFFSSARRILFLILCILVDIYAWPGSLYRFRKLKSTVNFQLECALRRDSCISLYSNSRVNVHVRVTSDCWERGVRISVKASTKVANAVNQV